MDKFMRDNFHFFLKKKEDMHICMQIIFQFEQKYKYYVHNCMLIVFKFIGRTLYTIMWTYNF
jgi:hypothetical protein